MDFEQFERVGTVVARYYLQPKAEPERCHFDDWINSLGEDMKGNLSEADHRYWQQQGAL